MYTSGFGLQPSAHRALALLTLLGNIVLAAKSTSGTCSKDKKCETGCCSKEGYCGFGPNFCGDDVCISNCDAVAECGPYAAVANTTCPLNVCCSEFGFCGTSPDFCGKGCQSGCDAVNQPSCAGTSSEQVYAGYYEAWNYQRPCDVIIPENIDVVPWTHLFYSFAGIDTDDSTIKKLYDHDDEYMKQMVALKKKKPELKVFISVGGWEVGGEPFSDMVRFSSTRNSFIESATSFMNDYGFDGIDVDWEYPGASDRGGRDEDTDNFVQFMKELKDACDGSYNITATLPSSYWYLKGFDVKGLSKYVDYFNFMSYDIHGTWDGNSEYTSSVINPHTNLTEISEGLDLLWRNDIDPAKVLLGLGFYGRSFTLNDTTCTHPGCSFDKEYESGGAAPGECSGTSGILTDYEINRVINRYDPEVVYNKQAAVNWFTWNNDQWVSFDNSKTLKQKADFANSRCMGGLFAWTLDEGGPGSKTNPNHLNASDTSMGGADSEGGDDGTGDLYVADSVLEPDFNTATGIAPLNIIVAPSTLSSATTFSVGPLVTALEVAWTTTETVTVSGQPTVTTTITRTVQTTTFSIPTITASVIPWWNWNITATNVTQASTALFPSFSLDPITFRDSLSSQNNTNITLPTLTGAEDRTFFPPPWPWSTTSLPVEVPTPTITFSEGGPPGPTCTSGCGTKCTSFCHTTCLDCNDPKDTLNWEDPADPDPPSHSRCSGPDCTNSECTGPYCVQKGCTGNDCDSESGVCLRDNCEPTGCRGDDCQPSGQCDGDDCQEVGCYGDDCNGSGRCLGLECISLGCIGLLCNDETGKCSGADCTKVSCTGPNCKNGICTGEGCESGDKDCESSEANVCTEIVYSSTISAASTYTTKTSTQCETITACDATPSTTTTTISEDEATGTLEQYPYASEDPAAVTSFANSMQQDFISLYSTTTTTTTTSTRTTTTATQTTADPHSPGESSTTCGQGQTMCHLFISNLHGFCNMAKSYIRGNELYGTTDGLKSGECYTDNSHAGTGCGVFIKGDGCAIKGSAMQAAYDHIFDDCDDACGHATFNNGCVLKVDYVSECSTQND
ncbi:hypothetical protein BDV06DRAFT_215028 [Aspergillus oleicola]